MNNTQQLSLKQRNRKIVLDMFRRSEILSVSEIFDETGISKPTIQKIINHYAEKRFIIPAGKGDSTDDGGKKPLLYSFNQSFGYIICIHLGPDFLYSAVVDMSTEILHSEYVRVDKIDADKVISMCAGIINEFASGAICNPSKLLSVVIALPGIVNPADGSLVYTPHFTAWGNNYPFVERLKESISLDIPVHCDNINRLQAFAEEVCGKAVNKQNFIIIDAMDEGLGSGIVVNGRLKHGAQNFSGEIGHMVLMAKDGPECICGGHGCFEALVGMKRIKSIIVKARQEGRKSEIFNADAGLSTLDRLIKAFRGGDELAVEIFDDIALWFALGINNVIMVNDPEMIILEGIYNAAGSGFLELILGHLQKLSYPRISREVDIVFSDFGKDRGILGTGTYGAWLYFKNPSIYTDE